MKIAELFPSLLERFVKTNNSNPSSTKKGPGRFHKDGYSLGSKRHRKLSRAAGRQIGDMPLGV